VPLREAFFIASIQKPRILGVVVTALISLAGCAVGPDFVRPAPPAVDHYTQGTEPTATVAADGRAQRFIPGNAPVAEWWRLFSSPKLDAVMDEALVNNPNIQAAQASLRQSQDNLRAGYGVFYPQVDAGFGASRQKSSPVSIGSSAPGSIFNLFTLSATVSYALDVFGGERRAVEGLQAQVDVQQATLIGTYLTLSGNIVNTMIARAAYGEQIAATGQIIGLLREQVGITEIQVRAGTVPYANVLSLRSQLASFEAALPPLKQNLSHAEHLLATLAGRAPAQWTPPQVDLADLTLPAEVPVSLPSKLVRQRPDILAAEAQLHSAGADIGVATAALFPSFTLNGTYGQNNTSMNNLFTSSGNFWSLGADVSAPLFRGGTLWFKRKAAQEEYQQTLATYRQTVLAALVQVADALRALEHDAEALQAQRQALETAGEALRLIQANYQAGIVNYLQVLTANGQYQQARIGYLQDQAQRLQDTVALFTALGGGWHGTDGDKPGSTSAGGGTEPNLGKGTVKQPPGAEGKR
jgi:NodT family efflux transporter outer membrane factor (OMF) lipoprotein